MTTEPATLECGCTITFDDPEPFASFTPCTEEHRTLARFMREPGSMILIGKVLGNDHGTVQA